MTAIAIAVSHGDLISSCAGVGGIWKRIASFNITAGDDCPSPWVKSSHNGVSFCIGSTAAADCYSVNYSTNGMSYQRVCGRASGYQKGTGTMQMLLVLLVILLIAPMLKDYS